MRLIRPVYQNYELCNQRRFYPEKPIDKTSEKREETHRCLRKPQNLSIDEIMRFWECKKKAREIQKQANLTLTAKAQARFSVDNQKNLVGHERADHYVMNRVCHAIDRARNTSTARERLMERFKKISD
jgi:hypothetical protein